MTTLRRSPILSLLMINAAAAALFWVSACASHSHRRNRPDVPPDFQPQLQATYAQLELRNLDQMRSIMDKLIRRGDRIIDNPTSDPEEGIAAYRDAMRLILSRPDQDGILLSLYIDLSKHLEDAGRLESVMQKLTTEGIVGLLAANVSDEQKITYVYLLNNLMAQVKPSIAANASLRDDVVRIRDADLEVTSSMERASLLRNMTPLTSPSEVADDLLNKIQSSRPDAH